MRWWSLVPFAFVLAAVAFGTASPARPQGSATQLNLCGARTARTAVVRFLVAFNRGDLAQLDRLIAGNAAFQQYAVDGAPGGRAATAARTRSTLIAYFAQRHRQSERLLLTRFGFYGRSLGNARFQFELVRSAADLAPPVLYIGAGAISCRGRHQLLAWAMRPNSEPRLPIPRSYAETCELVGSWCEIEQSPGAIPSALRRPLALPSMAPGGACPTTSGQSFDNSQFGGIALGAGPVQPIEVGTPVALATKGILVFRPFQGRGWYAIKMLWFARPDYQGPVLIRGRQLDGPHETVFGEAPALVDPQMGPGATINGTDGWREWPGGAWLRTPGCYAWQIDGIGFSHAIVFEALFRPLAGTARQ
jgi:hypothetical protein